MDITRVSHTLKIELVELIFLSKCYINAHSALLFIGKFRVLQVCVGSLSSGHCIENKVISVSKSN